MDNCQDCLEKDKEIEQLKGVIESIRQVDRQPWKGKDKPIIEKVSDVEWKVTTHVRAGKDEEPREYVKYVKNDAAKIVWFCIKKLTDDIAKPDNYRLALKGRKHKTDYHELSERIIGFYSGLNINLKEGNSTKLRNMGKHYFDKYLYPLYILEHLGYIKYSKNVYRMRE